MEIHVMGRFSDDSKKTINEWVSVPDRSKCCKDEHQHGYEGGQGSDHVENIVFKFLLALRERKAELNQVDELIIKYEGD